MIFDANLEFADAVSVAATAGTALIGSQIDLTETGPDIGAGTPVYLMIGIDTAIATGGSAGTVQFALVSDATAAISTTTSTVHVLTPVYVTDDNPTIPAGTILFAAALPQGIASWGAATDAEAGEETTTYQRFLGILCITGTTTTSAGKINAFLTIDPIVGWKAYADASN